jgi:hypothetical protein
VEIDVVEDPAGFAWDWFTKLLRNLVLIYVFSTVFLRGGSTATAGKAGLVVSSAGHANLFVEGTRLDLRAYLTSSAVMQGTDFSNPESLVWYERNILYDWSDQPSRGRNVTFQMPKSVSETNASVHLHVFISKTTSSPDPRDSTFKYTGVLSSSMQVIKYLPPAAPVSEGKNLLSEFYAQPEDTGTQPPTNPESCEAEADAVPDQWQRYWKPRLSIDLVVDSTTFSGNRIPTILSPHLTFDRPSGKYFPILKVNDFWLFREDLVLINASTGTLKLELNYNPLTLFRFQAVGQMVNSWQSQLASSSSSGAAEVENMKVCATVLCSPVITSDRRNRALCLMLFTESDRRNVALFACINSLCDSASHHF